MSMLKSHCLLVKIQSFFYIMIIISTTTTTRATNIIVHRAGFQLKINLGEQRVRKFSRPHTQYIVGLKNYNSELFLFHQIRLLRVFSKSASCCKKPAFGLIGLVCLNSSRAFAAVIFFFMMR